MDPRDNETRMSLALRHAGGRGQSAKHRLMLRAADMLAEIERTVTTIQLALERGDRILMKLRLKHIENVLGCGYEVINRVDTDDYQHSSKQNTSNDEN